MPGRERQATLRQEVSCPYVLSCIRGLLPLLNFVSSNFSALYTLAVQIKPALEVNLQVIFFSQGKTPVPSLDTRVT